MSDHGMTVKDAVVIMYLPHLSEFQIGREILLPVPANMVSVISGEGGLSL